jgi:hypothetical protein
VKKSESFKKNRLVRERSKGAIPLCRDDSSIQDYALLPDVKILPDNPKWEAKEASLAKGLRKKLPAPTF